MAQWLVRSFNIQSRVYESGTLYGNRLVSLNIAQPGERLQDNPVCGKCARALMVPEPVAISDAALPKFLAQTELSVVVDFWAAWCGPCRTMAPQFEAAAQQMPGVRFVKVDSDAAPMASSHFAIRSIPTLVLFHGGREVARQSGVMPAAQLLAWIRSQVDVGA